MMTYTRRDGYRFVWNGSKTINVYDYKGYNIDCFSLDYGRAWSESDVLEIMDHCDEWVSA
jgi:hypothetical protein